MEGQVLRKASYLFVFFSLMVLVLARNSYSQSAIDGFDPNANGVVWSIALQSDGKILVGGKFTSIGGQARNRIARVTKKGAGLH